MRGRHPDLLIIGAGIIGLSVARAARDAWPDAMIRVIDAAPGPGAHASGRNSGVLHAGFYYAPDSLKARFCRAGNRMWRDFCTARGLPLLDCGKLVVATSATECAGLERLHERARRNDVRTSLLSPEDARQIEPRVRGEMCLWSPDTAIVAPVRLLHALIDELRARDVRVDYGSRWQDSRHGRQRVDGAWFEPGHTINCAGLWSLRIARAHGCGQRYRILPFRGGYRLASRGGWLHTLVYPVPDPRFPFLGTHLTPGIGGSIRLGPTAAPALWYRQYGGLRYFRCAEAASIAPALLHWLATDRRAWRHVAREMRRWLPGAMTTDLRHLVEPPTDIDFRRRAAPGIRGQLICRKTGRLIDDFVVEQGDRSTHLLNTVSPGLTSAPAVAQEVVQLLRNRKAMDA